MSDPFPYSAQPAGLRLSDDLRLNEKQERKLRDFTWDRIIGGENDSDEFLEWAIDEFPKRKKKVLRAAFGQLLDARRSQQAAWPPAVATTQLAKAFDELAEIGVLARQNFACCGTCASAEIGGECDDTRAWRGYVYFHAQDAERIPESRETYLGYGAFLEEYLAEADWNALSDQAKDETYAKIVCELMAEATTVLERHDITVEWNHDLGTRILLRNVDWYAQV
jgi:hypothetical protein